MTSIVDARRAIGGFNCVNFALGSWNTVSVQGFEAEEL